VGNRKKFGVKPQQPTLTSKKVGGGKGGSFQASRGVRRLWKDRKRGKRKLGKNRGAATKNQQAETIRGGAGAQAVTLWWDVEGVSFRKGLGSDVNSTCRSRKRKTMNGTKKMVTAYKRVQPKGENGEGNTRKNPLTSISGNFRKGRTIRGGGKEHSSTGGECGALSLRGDKR